MNFFSNREIRPEILPPIFRTNIAKDAWKSVVRRSKKFYAEANHRYSITLNFDVRLYMYNYIIRCVETLLLTVRVVIITFFFFFFLTRYIASIKYVYNNVTHLLFESALNITCNAFLVVFVLYLSLLRILMYTRVCARVYVCSSRSKVLKQFLF